MAHSQTAYYAKIPFQVVAARLIILDRIGDTLNLQPQFNFLMFCNPRFLGQRHAQVFVPCHAEVVAPDAAKLPVPGALNCSRRHCKPFKHHLRAVTPNNKCELGRIKDQYWEVCLRDLAIATIQKP